MAAREKIRIVDSFTTLKAAQRRAQDGHAGAPPAPTHSAGEPDTIETPPRRPGTHIGRTVMPTRYEIVCSSCGFDFKITGKVGHTYCPKCRAQMDLTDYTLTGVCDGEWQTAGTVTLTSSAVLDGGRITANDVILEGTVKTGQLEARRTLAIARGAVIPEGMIQARHLRIAADAAFTFRRKAVFHDVDVHGELKANLLANGRVTIHPGGHFKGKLRTAHLCVLEGGGLSAEVCVQSDLPESPDKVSGERTK